ncbi:unnamed protein product [Musa acuminata subsp. burmannicoides]
MPVRSYAKEAAPSGLPPLKGDGSILILSYFLKSLFNKILTCRITLKLCLEPNHLFIKCTWLSFWMADLFSESQWIKYTIEQQTQGIPDARTYLLTLQEIRIKSGLTDDLGAETMMMEALEKVEKEIKKPLLRSDKKNMALLLAEFDKINQKLGIQKEDLPKYEEELELKIAKEDLQGLKKDVLEAMETHLKREEFKDEKMVNVKSLDIRNFIQCSL